MFNHVGKRICHWANPASLTLASIIATLGGAHAADLAIKAAAPSAPAYSWSGCYLGLNGGAGGGGSNFNTVVGDGTLLAPADAALVATTGGNGSGNATSWLGGGQAGCNWQSATFVYGVEGDFDYFRNRPQIINGTNLLSDGMTPFGVTQALQTDYFASVRGRLGVAADRNLFYVTGGAAFTQINYTQTYIDANMPPGSGSASTSKSLVGWTVGTGWEFAMTDNWIVRAEYLFAKFQSTNANGMIADGTGASNPLHGSADLVVQIARLGVNYKF
jgi:outer membrane immunogenic protein